MIFGFVFTFFLSGPVYADTLSFSFESPFTLGTIDSQFGWSSKCSTGTLDPVLEPLCDHFISPVNGLYSSFGAQSLRISNAASRAVSRNENIINQTYTRSLLNEAGETGAFNAGYSGGERMKFFEAEWDFASVTKEPQPGLGLQISPDRGDGSRYSFVRIMDTVDGMAVYFRDYKNGSFSGDQPVVEGLDRKVPHTVRLKIHFIDGPSNDIVWVYADNKYKLEGTSWEDYWRFDSEVEQEQGPRTVDSLVFKTWGDNLNPAPGTKDSGFYIDNIKLKSHAKNLVKGAPTNIDACKNDGWTIFTDPTFKNQGDCESYFMTRKGEEVN